MGDFREFLADYLINTLNEKKVIGLGTGSTVKKLIEILINKINLKDKIFVSSSLDTELLLSEHGLNSISLAQGLIPEVYIDSFDVFNGEVLIKGGGGALFREKLLAENSLQRIFVGDRGKYKFSRTYTIPIEVEVVSVKYVMNKIKSKGYVATPRNVERGKYGPIISDNGNIIVDVEVPGEKNLCEIHKEFKNIVGVVETGIFCKEYYDYVILADDNGRLEVFKKS